MVWFFLDRVLPHARPLKSWKSTWVRVSDASLHPLVAAGNQIPIARGWQGGVSISIPSDPPPYWNPDIRHTSSPSVHFKRAILTLSLHGCKTAWASDTLTELAISTHVSTPPHSTVRPRNSEGVWFFILIGTTQLQSLRVRHWDVRSVWYAFYRVADFK